MEKIKFEQLDEQLYYEKLDNGLQVYILPKEGYNKTYATFTTNYGSIDNEFVPLGKTESVKVTDGIAHFLEHKMFEKEDGDVFQQFSKQGASANAFTSFTRTAYLFSSTNNVEENLVTLLDFVQQPYFSDDTVEKEKGIIDQEITMYDDNPDWRLYFGAISNMYDSHPVKIDIAGTSESIAVITKEMLYECYETFYHPSNMILFVVGSVEPEKIMKLIRENQNSKKFIEPERIERIFAPEQTEVAERKQVLQMNVQMPKCLVGIKGNNVDTNGPEMLKRELAISVMFELLFGRSTNNYTNLNDEGLIDDSFSADYTEERGFGFAIIGGDTNEPEKLAEKIEDILINAKINYDFTEDNLERAKKKKIGSFLRALNSVEYIANQFTRYAFNDMDLFQVVPTLESLTVEDIKFVADELISKDRLTVCQVVPKNS